MNSWKKNYIKKLKQKKIIKDTYSFVQVYKLKINSFFSMDDDAFYTCALRDIDDLICAQRIARGLKVPDQIKIPYTYRYRYRCATQKVRLVIFEYNFKEGKIYNPKTEFMFPEDLLDHIKKNPPYDLLTRRFPSYTFQSMPNFNTRFFDDTNKTMTQESNSYTYYGRLEKLKLEKEKEILLFHKEKTLFYFCRLLFSYLPIFTLPIIWNKYFCKKIILTIITVISIIILIGYKLKQ